MTPERYKEIEYSNGILTEPEINEGWHFCREWDSMLIHPSWPEASCCTCRTFVGFLDKNEQKL